MKNLHSERGIVTIIALIMVAMLTLIGLAALSTSDDEASMAGNELQEKRAFYAAEAGLEAAAAGLQQQWVATGLPPTVMPNNTESMNNCTINYSASDNGAAVQRVLSTGTLSGLHALVKSFTMTSSATNDKMRSRVMLQQSFETALVPIFQFAVFYGQDLEMHPGPDMTLVGRVHSNGDLWVHPVNSLRIDSYMTASGKLIHGDKKLGYATRTGDVQIKDFYGNYQSMKQGGTWIDNNYANWFDSSISKWSGRVQDEAHGVQELNVPLSNSTDPHVLIERAAGNPDSYEHKSTLKFIDGVAYQKVGSVWQDVTASMVADGVIAFAADQFYDDRENKWVDVMELDVDQMYSNGYAPDNGVIYFSDDITGPSDFAGLRLKNAQELDAGLTIASENPLYTLGDYNSVNKKPSAFLSDAFTALSGGWDDAKSSLNLSDRLGQETTINVSYLTGANETTSSSSSGGFHNLIRFLEDWSGRDLHWKGSAVHLWFSRYATGEWNLSYYSPPYRDLQYDSDLDDPTKLPPETPVVRIFQRTGWQQLNVGYAEAATAIH